MDITCTKCGSMKVYNVVPEELKEKQNSTMDEVAFGNKTSNLVYKMTTLRCAQCGYEVSY